MHVRAIWLGVFLAALGGAAPLSAQGLRDQLSELFVFENRDGPLLLLGPAESSDPAAGAAVNRGFVPDASQANATVITFLGSWMRGTVANAPTGSTGGGVSFRFEGGAPVETQVSPGPILGEAARTLGPGRAVVGISHSAVRFNALRGVPLSDLRFNLTHRNADGGCAAGQSTCSPAALPPSASDVVELRVGLDFDLAVTSLFAGYGVREGVDVGLVVPVVHAALSGTSEAQVLPFSSLGGGQPATFIAGTADDPVLRSTQSVSGSATGVGDVAARLKVRLRDDGRTGVAVLGEVRFPTGDEDNLLGAGALSARGVGIVSARLGDFSPFANLGYRYWEGDAANDAVLATVGFDQLLGPRASFAASLVSEFQVGASVFRLPEPVTIREPFVRTIRPVEIPDIRDDALSASLGFRFIPQPGLVATVNGVAALTRGGPRPDLALSAGLQYGF